MRNDNYIKYDIHTHRHSITPEYFRDKYGEELAKVLDSTNDINSATLPERWLNRVSLVVHNYIYRYAKNKLITEYKLATDDEYIDCLQEAMGEQAFAMLMENNDNTLSSGIDIDKGKIIDRIDLQKAAVAPIVEDVLRNGKLLFRGSYIGFDYSLLEGKGTVY